MLARTLDLAIAREHGRQFFVQARALHALLREDAFAAAQFGVLRVDVVARDRRDRLAREFVLAGLVQQRVQRASLDEELATVLTRYREIKGAGQQRAAENAASGAAPPQNGG